MPKKTKLNVAKIRKVLREFKAGLLKTPAGSRVVDRKQALAIALSEARRSKRK